VRPSDIAVPIENHGSAAPACRQPLSSQRSAPLEGVRGLAAFVVFFVHYNALFGGLAAGDPVSALVARTLTSIGHSGVDLFFLLSGFLIYGTLVSKPKGFWSYIRRRIQRIYPTFLTVLSLYLVLSFVFPSESKLPDGVGAATAYVLQNALLLPGIFEINPIVTVAWSLSYEFFFYLTIPLLVGVFGLRRWPSRQRMWLLTGFFVVGCLLYLVVRRHSQVLMFIAGAIVYDAMCREWPQSTVRRLHAAAVLILLASIPLLYAVEMRPDIGDYVFGPKTLVPQLLRTTILAAGFGSLVFACLSPGTRAGKTFSWQPLLWFGRISYSYYLVHGLTIKAAALVFHKLPLNSMAFPTVLYWVNMPIVFLATVIAATCLFLTIERPLSIAPAGATQRPPKPAPQRTLRFDGETPAPV
jgi:peptidoglycan/LPS O-acetylase OafA/YrhL